MPTKPSSTTEALRLKAVAKRKRAYAKEVGSRDATGAHWERKEARDMDAAADEYLDLDAHTYPRARPQVGRGGELTPVGEDARKLPGLVDTVRSSPDYATAQASLKRLELAADVGPVDLAVDAADTIQARNSLEKMLAHQMAAAHSLAMKFAGTAVSMLEQMATARRPEFYSVEAARLANTSVRLMETYQRSLLTLERFRNGGRQTVTVKHVHVNPGGRAIIGHVKTGGMDAGEPSENAR